MKRKNPKIYGTSQKPRVSVFRSNRYISAQFIDDEQGKTLIAFSSRSLVGKGKPVEIAILAGAELAKNAKTKNIISAVYDRGKYRYHGQVKAFAEGLRQGGMQI